MKDYALNSAQRDLWRQFTRPTEDAFRIVWLNWRDKRQAQAKVRFTRQYGYFR